MQWGCHNSDCLAVVCVRVEFRHEFNSDSPTTVWLFTHTCQHHSAMCAVCAPPSCGLLDCELHNIVAGRAYARDGAAPHSATPAHREFVPVSIFPPLRL